MIEYKSGNNMVLFKECAYYGGKKTNDCTN